jgi:hypothetical protein
MVNTEPLKKYIKSRDALKEGDPERAAQLLAESVGAKEPTPYMKEAIEELTEPNQPVLTLILNESKEDPDGR